MEPKKDSEMKCSQCGEDLICYHCGKSFKEQLKESQLRITKEMSDDDFIEFINSGGWEVDYETVIEYDFDLEVTKCIKTLKKDGVTLKYKIRVGNVPGFCIFVDYKDKDNTFEVDGVNVFDADEPTDYYPKGDLEDLIYRTNRSIKEIETSEIEI